MSTPNVETLRQRLPHQPDAPQQADSVQSAEAAVKQLNQGEQEKGKDERHTRTYGRTPDGTGEHLVQSVPAQPLAEVVRPGSDAHY